MKQTPPNQFRIKTGPIATTDADGMMGGFIVRLPGSNTISLTVVAADDRLNFGWEHVSVSTTQRCPTWDEMCYIKNLFWEEDETVIQFHPKKSQYRNVHPYCLHLWKSTRGEHVLPPSIFVG